MIVEDDKKIYENSNPLLKPESYRSEYRIQIGDRQALVLEQTNPYINKMVLSNFMLVRLLNQM